MKRIFLFLLTNVAVLVVLSVVVRLLGLDRALAANGLDVGALAGLFGGGRIHRRDHFAFDFEADGQVVDRGASDRHAAQ